MKQITCIGIGLGNPDTLTIAAKHAIESCDLLIGASRMLACFSHVTCSTFASCKTNEICDYILQHPEFQNIRLFYFRAIQDFTAAPKVLPMNSNEWEQRKEYEIKTHLRNQQSFLISVPNCKFPGTISQSSACTEEKLPGFPLCAPIQKLFY